MLRQLVRVDAIGRQLEEIHKPVASYYRGLAAQRYGSGNLSEAQNLLEYAADSAPRSYQARALLALGSITEYKQDYRAEIEFYRQALELNRSDVFTAVETRRALALSEARAGNHARAIEILESILPLAQHQSYLCAQLLNSLAVEYQALGKLQDALRLAQIVCKSPLASVYYEWTETREEIRQDIAAQESSAVIVVIQQVQKVAQAKGEGKQEQARSVYVPSWNEIQQPAIKFLPAMGRNSLIQSRVRYSIQPHAPPFRAEK